MGIDGIVLGTITARFCGGMLMLGVLAAGRSGLKLARGEWTLRGETVRRILRIGVPAAFDGLIMWAGHFAFLTIVSYSGGRFAFAAHVVGIQVEAITYLPAVAWGRAAATMIGQSLGARNPPRAYRAGHEAVAQCSLLAAVLTLVFFAGAGPIFEVMHRDETVREIGVPAFRLLAFFQVPLVVSIIYVHSLHGAGETRSPMLITLFGVLAVRLPLAYVCGVVLEGGLIGAWIGMFADVTVRAGLVAVRFARGRWNETVV
jgi:multidrug resistance protein, MATE family